VLIPAFREHFVSDGVDDGTKEETDWRNPAYLQFFGGEEPVPALRRRGLKKTYLDRIMIASGNLIAYSDSIMVVTYATIR
jgi:hypothetical protein